MKGKHDMTLRKISKGTSRESWALDDVAACGRVWTNVVIVLEPLSANPLIDIRGPFGLRGVKKAVKLVETERKKLGLVTPKA